MKTIIAVVAAVLLTASTAYAYVSYTYTDAKNTSYINNQLFDQKNLMVVRFQDTVGTTTNTCYIIHSTKEDTNSRAYSPSISCVK